MIKSVINEVTKNNENENKYPYLGIYESETVNRIVLFTSEKNGILVYSDNSFDRIGTISMQWAEYLFQKYNGYVELFNGD